MSNTIKITLTTLAAFGAYFLFDSAYFNEIRSGLNKLIHQGGVSHNIAYLIVGIPIFAGAWLISGRREFFSNLGLNKSFWQALAFAVICTLPMFLGFAFFFDFTPSLKVNAVLVGVVAAGFFEELYFRAFLFGQLFKHTALGFITSVFLGALLFGMVHLYQSTDPLELAGIFLITFLGAILFAWAYAEWNYNLWVPVLLHALMNLAWEVSNISDNALGGIYSNIFRTLTIALIIGVTIIYKKRKGLPLAVSRRNLWLKNRPETALAQPAGVQAA